MQGRGKGNPQGIDVSHWQGTIDWQKVKEDGIQFAFIKATEGKGYTDPLFIENVREARRAGIRVGFYHYATPSAVSDAEEEANWFLSVVRNLQHDLPHAYDLEENKAGLTPDQMTAVARRWLERVNEETGEPPLFYSYPHFIRTQLVSGRLAPYPLWLASYSSEPPADMGGWDRWTVLQYTNQGKVSGILGPVDMNEYAYPLDGGEKMLQKEDADKIIRFLSAAWYICKTEEDRQEFHRLANELRKVSGQPIEGEATKKAQ